ncbi:hypothetical protein [Devosia submarina]|uniref:hypothetical protein n=1 Tax=Devosia submarina TaxID=1173082 RepID=UPI000D382CB9|nr:hypothetical protein [Devosia submarina]
MIATAGTIKPMSNPDNISELAERIAREQWWPHHESHSRDIALADLDSGSVGEITIEFEDVVNIVRAALTDDIITSLQARLLEAEKALGAAAIYYERYCQDEADDVENCVCGQQQHEDAIAFRAAASKIRGEG